MNDPMEMIRLRGMVNDLLLRVEELEGQSYASPDKPLVSGTGEVMEGMSGMARVSGADKTFDVYDATKPWVTVNKNTGAVERVATRSNPNDAHLLYYHQDHWHGDIVV